MATVHPSRMGLVPGARIPKSPPAPSAPVSREEGLRQQLLERRRDRDMGSDANWQDGQESSRGRPTSDDVARQSARGDESKELRERRRDRLTTRWDERPEDSARDTGKSRRSPRPERQGYDVPPHVRDNDRSAQREDSFIPLNRNGSGDGQPPHAGEVDISRYGYGRERGDLPHGPPANAPWREQGRGWQGPPHRTGLIGPMGFEKRRQERMDSTLSIWPPSPREPYRDEDELEAERRAARRAKKLSKSSRAKRRHRRYSDESSSSETDSEEERRRRRRRERRERKRRGYSDGESEDDTRQKRRRSKSKAKEDVADQWVEKGGEVVFVPPPRIREAFDIDDDDEVGPRLPTEPHYKERRDRTLYDHMLPGEAEAMAAYAASGERIPRRGEIGLEADKIEAFEQSGYVMSGNRHKRMTAVRLRKENQVINAEEKRAILNLQREERMKREGAIITQFKEMMDDSLRKQGLNKS